MAQAWTQRFGEKLNANLVKQAKIEANRSLSASAKKAALRDVRSERRILRSGADSAGRQLARILELAFPSDARTLDEWLAGVGCP